MARYKHSHGLNRYTRPLDVINTPTTSKQGWDVDMEPLARAHVIRMAGEMGQGGFLALNKHRHGVVYTQRPLSKAGTST
jgi:hypothetical protein